MDDISGSTSPANSGLKRLARMSTLHEEKTVDRDKEVDREETLSEPSQVKDGQKKVPFLGMSKLAIFF